MHKLLLKLNGRSSIKSKDFGKNKLVSDSRKGIYAKLTNFLLRIVITVFMRDMFF